MRSGTLFHWHWFRGGINLIDAFKALIGSLTDLYVLRPQALTRIVADARVLLHLVLSVGLNHLLALDVVELEFLKLESVLPSAGFPLFCRW